MSAKQRVDSLMVQQGLAESRTRAQAYIMAGRVFVAENKVLKPSEQYSEDTVLSLRGESDAYASRGAHKLVKGLDSFGVDPTGLVCMDIGAATGGFTDVLLRRGAKHVYAVDVGYGQFDWRLRQDERVTLWERTNARNLTAAQFDQLPSLCVMDVSFISLRLLLPALAQVMDNRGTFVCLVKPQFEAGRGQVGKNGVVRDAAIHRQVIMDIRDFVTGFGYHKAALTYSPIKGPKGNIEFLAHLVPGPEGGITDEVVHALVDTAHQSLHKED